MGTFLAHSAVAQSLGDGVSSLARRFAPRPVRMLSLQIMADEAAQYGGATTIVCGPESFVSAVAVSVKPFPGKFRFVHESFRW